MDTVTSHRPATHPNCLACAHALPLAFHREGSAWVPVCAHPLIDDGQSFDDVAGLLESSPPRQIRCCAPQLGAVLDGNSSSELCNAVRHFSCACGIEGKWFQKREGKVWSYHSKNWPIGNSGQSPDAHAPHADLPEQTSGRQNGG